MVCKNGLQALLAVLGVGAITEVRTLIGAHRVACMPHSSPPLELLLKAVASKHLVAIIENIVETSSSKILGVVHRSHKRSSNEFVGQNVGANSMYVFLELDLDILSNLQNYSTALIVRGISCCNRLQLLFVIYYLLPTTYYSLLATYDLPSAN